MKEDKKAAKEPTRASLELLVLPFREDPCEARRWVPILE